MILNILKFIAFTLLLFQQAVYADELELPELGDSSATSLSPKQEQQIGSEVVRRMRNAGYIIEDPLIDSYISQLGNSLVAHTESEQKFKFFVVNAQGINAFALPGGYIGVHSGLIQASHTESELASVLAHEIAHVTQHHLARGVEQANRMQLPLTVALIAAILLSGGDPDVANAAIASSLGGSAQMQLNFTRDHEHEADRIGMQLLASSEYNPHGMAAFFKRLQEESRYYGDGVPEFLSTHPVTTTRLAEAQSAAERYPNKMHVDSDAYLIAKSRIRLHHSKSAISLMETLNKTEGEVEGKNKELNQYLRAITHIELQEPEKAEAILKSLLTRAPSSIAYRETLGQLHYFQGEYGKAISLLRDGLKRYPQNEMLALSLAKNLIAIKNYSEARKVIHDALRSTPNSTHAYRLLGELETGAGNQAAAHLAQAEYYRRLEEPHSALQQLKMASRIENLDFYHASRIEALTREVIESIEASGDLPN